MEVMEARMFQVAELNGDLSDDDSGSESAVFANPPSVNQQYRPQHLPVSFFCLFFSVSSLYKEKYERAVREFDFKTKRLKQQHEEELEQELVHRKALDKKVGQFYVRFFSPLKGNRMSGRHPHVLVWIGTTLDLEIDPDGNEVECLKVPERVNVARQSFGTIRFIS